MKKVVEHAQKNISHYGGIVFGIGLLIVVIGSLIQLSTGATRVVIGILMILGLLVGVINVTREEALSFLMASLVIVLLLGQSFLLITQYFLAGQQSQFLLNLLTFINALIIPAAVIVALRVFFTTAKDR